MPLGDSITQGDSAHDSYRRELWRLLEAQALQADFVGSQRDGFGGGPPNPDFDRDHEGHWGFRADEILAGLENWVRSARPDVVLVHLGTNDLLQGQSVSSIAGELEELIRLLRTVNPRVAVLLAQVVPSSLLVVQTIDSLNSAISSVASRASTSESPVIAVDQATGFDPLVHTYDGVHPNALGERKMAAVWLQALRRFF
jgi:acyl-CoA thioesterase I